jgi:hypothetical protein
MPDTFDPFKDYSVNNEQPQTKKSAGNSLFYNIVIVAGIALVSVMATATYFMTMKPKNDATEFTHNSVVAELKSKSVLFCNQFFNLSYSTYKDARRRAEEYMTSNLLTEYKEVMYDTPFTDEIMSSSLATDYIYNQVIEGVLDGKAAIKVIGVIKYTSVKKNVSVEMPITAVLIWTKDTNSTWKIDNLVLEM